MRPTVRILWVGLVVCQLSTPAAAQVCKFFSPFDLLRNQTLVNNFQQTNGPCTRLRGNLYLEGASITDLTPLGLESVGGSVTLFNTGVTSLAGLEKLTTIGDDAAENMPNSRGLLIFGNNSLTNLNALSNLSSFGGMVRITDNAVLQNIDALASITKVGIKLDVFRNPRLTSVAGLRNVTSIGGDMVISDNDELLAIDFSALVTAQIISIFRNPKVTVIDFTSLQSANNFGVTDSAGLTDLLGLENLEEVTFDFNVFRNPNLSSCCNLLPVAQGDVSIGRNLFIGDNSPGCNSTVDIILACSVPSADLVLNQTNSSDPVAQGQTFKYTLTVTNNGPDSAENVVIADMLPGVVTLVSTSGCAEDPNGIPACSLGSLDAESSKSVEIEVTANAETLGEITNEATVMSATMEAAPGNERASETTEVVAPPNSDLGLEKTAATAKVLPHDELEFDLTITNDGPQDALGITVTDTLPEDITFLGASNDTADCSEASGTVTCTIGELAADDSLTITLATTVNTETPGELVNQADLETAGNDPNPDNDSSEATVTVLARGDLNRDGVIDALDVSTLVQEINDGDGEDIADVEGGTFPGTAGFDLNGDDLVNADDIGPAGPVGAGSRRGQWGTAAETFFTPRRGAPGRGSSGCRDTF